MSLPCAAARLERQPDGPPPLCAIQVEFHARGGEIDMGALDRVLRLVETEPAVNKAYDERRGPGEPDTLCLVVERQSEAVALYERLTAVLPAQGRRLPRMKPRPAVVLRLNGS